MDLGLSLEKGLYLNMTKEYSTLRRITMGLGWDATHNGRAWDLDSIAVMLDAEGYIVDVVSFKNKKATGVMLDKDNMTGEGDGADENIFVDLDKRP